MLQHGTVAQLMCYTFHCTGSVALFEQGVTELEVDRRVTIDVDSPPSMM